MDLLELKLFSSELNICHYRDVLNRENYYLAE